MTDTKKRTRRITEAELLEHIWQLPLEEKVKLLSALKGRIQQEFSAIQEELGK
jgi:hypothetical protein